MQNQSLYLSGPLRGLRRGRGPWRVGAPQRLTQVQRRLLEANVQLLAQPVDGPAQPAQVSAQRGGRGGHDGAGVTPTRGDIQEITQFSDFLGGPGCR